jgi:dTDP-4-amino-4,6-dideoxygalactose transaminase
MESLLQLAGKHGLYVIEDTAQALGAEYTFSNNSLKKAGTMGTIGATSFFPSKNLGCFGDGGAVFTNDPELAEKMKMIANHGQRVKYHHDVIGINSRLDTIQAAILNVKLKYLDQYTQKRQQVAAYYDKSLAHIDFLETPYQAGNTTHVYHQYTLRIKNRSRDNFKQYLESNGVPTMIYYPLPLHFQTAYKRKGYEAGSFPMAEALSKSVISLPIHTEMTEEELDFVCQKIKNF